MLNLKSIEAIIFDMDGVIVDSEYIQVEAEKIVCKNHNISVPDSEWMGFKGKKNIDIFKYIVQNFTDGSLDPRALADEKGQIYLKIAPEKLKLIAGSMEFIHKAKKYFPRLALVTSSGPLTQGLAFDLFKLHPHFEIIVTGKDVNNGKPHPEPYLKAVERLGLSAERCLVIEDSDSGIRSAKSAGCQTVGITTSFTRNILEKAGADFVVDSFSELGKLFVW